MHLRTSFRLMPEQPRVLTFAPVAWLKLQFFCHVGDTEIGGFGVAAADNPLYIEEFVTVQQEVTPVSVHFADEAVADYFDQCVDRGLKPESFARVWLHTHPGDSVIPSHTDEETLAHCFGRCDWAVMFILGHTGKTYARLAFHVGPGAELVLPTAVDWSAWPQALAGLNGTLEGLYGQWQQEYAAHVRVLPDLIVPWTDRWADDLFDHRAWWDHYPWSPELDETFYELVEDPAHEPISRPRSS